MNGRIVRATPTPTSTGMEYSENTQLDVDMFLAIFDAELRVGGCVKSQRIVY